jgi:hypothetical protein
MKQTYFITIISLVLLNNFCSKLFSQSEADSVKQVNKTEKPVDFKNLSSLHVGYYGTTQNCKAFNIYGFKYKRTWLLIANQDMNLTYLVARPPRSEGKKVVPGSNFLFEGLSKANEHNYTKLKKRRRVIKDIEIYGFYKFHRPGKKAMKGLLLLEYPELEMGPPWPFKWIGDKAAEAAKSAEGVIPEINTEVPPLPEIPVETPPLPPIPE